MSSAEDTESEDLGEGSSIFLAEINEVVKKLQSCKAPALDEIRLEMLKALDIVELSWLKHLVSVTWRSKTVLLEWQTGVMFPIFKKGDRRVCSNYQGITLLSLPGKFYSRVLERRLQPIITLWIQKEQHRFYPGHGTTDQLFPLACLLVGFMGVCLSSLPVFCGLEESLRPCLPGSTVGDTTGVWVIGAIDASYLVPVSENCVYILSTKSNMFLVCFGLSQGCPLCPILFVISWPGY